MGKMAFVGYAKQEWGISSKEIKGQDLNHNYLTNSVLPCNTFGLRIFDSSRLFWFENFFDSLHRPWLGNSQVSTLTIERKQKSMGISFNYA